MSIRRLFFYLLFVFVFIAMAGIPTKSLDSGQNYDEDKTLIAGRNVNMVSGTQLPNGDPWLQRQNEPSIAASTRNPLHLLAGANDYRTIDIPGKPEDVLPGQEEKKTAQAPREPWLGVFKSFDGGQSWISTLLPGFPQDESSEGWNSPLYQMGYHAAADPVVRAGTNGLFYYSGIAFNRDTMEGVVFVSRFIDNNNLEKGDCIKYLDTKVIDIGNVDQFLDKPWIVVDIPRNNSEKVTIDGQSIPKHNVYIAFSEFSGQAETLESKIFFARSTDCGENWNDPIRINSNSIKGGKKKQKNNSKGIPQGSVIAVDPRGNGHVYIAWRLFSKNKNKPGTIYVVKYDDYSNSFTDPIEVAKNYMYFDQGTSAATFRTNSYPTMAVDDSGIVYLAWAERIRGRKGPSRIMLSTSTNGKKWSDARPIEAEEPPGHQYGHQIMPSLTFAAGKLMMVWYDQRNDISGRFTEYIDDRSGEPRHTLDVRVAQAEPGKNPIFEPSKQVSRYLFVLTGQKPNYSVKQIQFNPVNYPLFKIGTWPFMGDYIDIAPSPMFVLDDSGHWRYNTEPSDSTIFHVVWTDNRDIRPPLDGKWDEYNPPNSIQEDPNFYTDRGCYFGDWTKAGMRNQNIYTSRITQGIVAGSFGNTKPLGTLGETPDGKKIPRAFVVFVKNSTDEIKSFRLTIANQPPDGRASFLEFDLLDRLDVKIAPHSSISRSVFVYSPEKYATVKIYVAEIYEPNGQLIPDGLESSVILNPDIQNPDIQNPDIQNPDIQNPDIQNAEVHNPDIMNIYVNPDIMNPDIQNPDIMNPDIQNPDIMNPDIMNPDIQNPDIQNPDIMNPDIQNPDIQNPDIMNPDIMNTSIADPSAGKFTDVIWDLQNTGNTTSTFVFKTLSTAADEDGTLPDGIQAQLLIYRTYTTPAEHDTQGNPCALGKQEHQELILNIINPDIQNPDIQNIDLETPDIQNPDIMNATFSLEPEGIAKVILRLWKPYNYTQSTYRTLNTARTLSFNDPNSIMESFAGFTSGTSRNTTEQKAGIPTYASDSSIFLITTKILAPGEVGLEYSDFLTATGGEKPYTSWSIVSGSLPAGLSLNSSTGEISGTPTTAGTSSFTAQIMDTDGQTRTKDLWISISPTGVTEYTISGRVTVGGSGLEGVAMNGLPGTPTTDSVGYYTTSVESGWSGTVTPTKLGYTIDPLETNYPPVNSNITTIYTAYPKQVDRFLVETAGGGDIGTQTAYVPFSIMITALDSDGLLVPTYLDTNTLSDSTGTISPTTTGAFTNGTWTGDVTITAVGTGVTITTLGAGKTSVSNVFDVTAGVATILRIEDADDGTGNEVDTKTIGPGEYFKVYAMSRNIGNNFVENIPVTWSLIEKAGVVDGDLVPAADNKSATFNGQTPGTAKIKAIHATLGDDTTGTITVIYTQMDDTYEENDDFGSAAEIFTKTYPNLQLLDEDWYKILVDADMYLKVTITGVSENNIDLGLADSSGKYLVGGLSSSNEDTIYFNTTSAGYYYIRVPYTWGGGLQNTYTLTAEINDGLGLGQVFGKVTDSTNNPLHVRVRVYDRYSYRKWNTLTDATTGEYRISMPAGSYKIRFITSPILDYYGGINYLSEYSNNKPRFAEAPLIEVQAGATITDIDGQLEQGGTITGSVRDLQGNTIEGAFIRVRDLDGYSVVSAYSDASGQYTIVRLATGYFKAYVRSWTENHGIEWYNDKPSFNEANAFYVDPSQPASGIDFQLTEGGNVEGRVTDVSGGGVSGITVVAYDSSQTIPFLYPSAQIPQIALRSTSTGDNGNYFMNHLPNGNVSLYFNTSNTNHVPEWYDDASKFIDSVPVPIQAGQTTSDINVELAESGAVGGRVTNSSGDGIKDVLVWIFNLEGGGYYQKYVYTNDDGYYRIDRIPVGNVKVRFRPNMYTNPYTGNWAVEWYGNKNSYTEAAEVTVVANETTWNVDAELAENGGNIEGRVTNGSQGIGGVYVSAYDSSIQAQVSFVYTDSDGYYSIPRIPTCDVRLVFFTGNNKLPYVSEFYSNQSSYEDAIPVSVWLDETTFLPDVVLSDLPDLAVTTTSLPNGDVGTPYSQALVAEGGTKHYHWSLAPGSGPLPNGLYLSSTGVIEGTPTSQGTFPFTVQVVDYSNPPQVATQGLSITISAYGGPDFLISGSVTFNGSPLQWVLMDGLPDNTRTNASGDYIAFVSSGWAGTVTPSLSGYAFVPYSTNYTDVTSNQLNQNYDASTAYTISGIVTIDGSPLQGVLMSGIPGDPRTDTDGYYTGKVPSGWAGTVIPTSPGFTFDPENKSYSDVTSEQANQDYSANYMGGQDDALEENDDFNSASEITPGTYTDLVLLDEDWFKFYITAADAGKDLKVHLKGTSYPNPNQRFDLDFQIFDGSGKLLSVNLSGGDDETIYITDLTEGWYYVGQTYIGQVGTVYSMTVEVSDNFGIGYISGKITDEEGYGIENIYVELYGDPFDWDICRPLITTDSNGEYKVGFVPGNYKVRFNVVSLQQYNYDWAPDINYIGEYYDNKPFFEGAAILSIVADTTISGIDAGLIEGGTITGTITDPFGIGVGNVRARVYDSNGRSINFKDSDENGYYTVDRIPPGYFKVFAYPRSGAYAAEWYNDKPSHDEATGVSVESGQTIPGIDFQLTEGGSIEGRVIDEQGYGIQNIRVYVYDATLASQISLRSSVRTDENGYYSLDRLPNGNIRVFFNTVGSHYVAEWYDDKFLFRESDLVSVSEGQTTPNIDAVLAEGGSIEGRVTDLSDNGLNDIYVSVFDLEGRYISSVYTNENGNYYIERIPQGNHRVRFRPHDGNWAVEWYDDKTSYASADQVLVEANQTISGIDAQLAENGGYITGTVTDIYGYGIGGVRVLIFDNSIQAAVSWVFTNASGYYSAPRIPTSNVKVYFNTDYNRLISASEFYDDQNTFENATLVPAQAGETISGIDAVLGERPPLTVTTASLPGGIVATPFSATLGATGGTPNYHWSLAPGSNPLPNGLILQSSGLIEGTPTSQVTFPFTVQVIDSGNPQQVATEGLSITIGAYGGTDYIISGTVTYGGSPLRGVVMDGLPGNPTTNVLGNYLTIVPSGWSGTVTPTLPGYFFDPPSRNYDNVSGHQENHDYSAFYGEPLRITTTSLPDGTKDASYSVFLEVEAPDGIPPFEWSLIEGSLPDGLILETSGEIHGVPSKAGDFILTVQVIDNSSPQKSATQYLTLYIAPHHQGFWDTTYPYGGNINSAGLVLDPSNPNVIYAAANWRGIFKSEDAGGNWDNITDYLDLPFDRTDTRIIKVRRNPDEFFTVSHGRIFKSYDEGINWDAINNGISGHVQALTFHPAFLNVLYAGTQENGIFKTSDGGAGWSNVSSGLPSDEIRSIAVDPDNPSTVYAGTLNNGIYKSTDDGMSWFSINNNVNLARIDDIVMDPSDTGIIYLACNEPATGDGIFKSTGGGDTWTKLPVNVSYSWPSGNYIAIDPSNTLNIYSVSYQSVHKSTDGGDTWTESQVTPHHVNTIVIDPFNETTLYAGTDTEGVFKSTDSGQNWTAVNNGIQALNFPHSHSHSLTIDQSNPQIIYAGSINGGLKSTNKGLSWGSLNLNEWQVGTLATHASDPGAVYAFNHNLWKSTDYGVTWMQLTGSGDICCFGDGDFVIASSSPSTFYLAGLWSGSTPNGIYKSTDSGSTWMLMNNGLTNETIRTLAVHPTNVDIVFAGTMGDWPIDPAVDYGLFKTTDGGVNWSHINCGLPEVLHINQIAIYPGDPNFIYMASEGENSGVYRSDDGGNCWWKIFNDNASSVAIDPGNPEIVYVGTWNSGGFYVTLNGGGTWTQLNDGLPVNPGIESIAIDPENPRHVFIGTTAGVYEATLNFDFTVTTEGLPEGVKDESYSVTLKAMGGTVPYTWNVIEGALPTGLTINSSGLISGIPTAPGTFHFRVQVTDDDESLQQSYTKIFNITILNTYTLTTTVNPGAGGSLSRNPEKPKYVQGEFVELNITPNTGYAFTGWSGDASGMTNPIHVQMTRDKNITANLALIVDLPDYYVDSLSAPSQADAGEIIGSSLNLIVGNQGAHDLYPGDIFVAVYLSSDPVITTGDILLWKGRSSITALGAGGTTSDTINADLQIPTTVSEGDYHIGALVDESNVIAEQDETNNYSSLPISITSTEYGYFDIVGYWDGGSTYGIAVDEARNLALIGHGGSLEILDISDPSNPVKRSKLHLSSSLVVTIVTSGNLAYIANGAAGLKVVDFSDAYNPVEIGSCDTFQSGARSIDISGNYAYVTDYHQGLRVIDISIPTSPTEIAFLPLPYLSREIKVFGDYAYVTVRCHLAGGEGAPALRIIDVSQPADPTLRSTYGFRVNAGIPAIDDTGQYLFVPTAGDGLRILDVSNPDLPSEVSFYDGAPNQSEVTIRGNHAFLDDYGNSRAVILDISNVLNPVEISSYWFEDQQSLYGFEVAGDLWLVNRWYDSVRILNISDIYSPYEVGSYNETQGLNYFLDISDDHAFIINYKSRIDRLKVLDISNLSDITETATHETPYNIYGIDISGNHAYIPTFGDGLRIADITDPLNPEEVGSYEELQRARYVVVSGNYAYVADGWDGLRIFDISTPSNPILVSTWQPPGYAWRLALSGNYAYVAYHRNGLKIIDVSDPLNPWEVGSLEFQGRRIRRVAVSENYAYITDEYKTLRVIDVSNPGNPTEVSSFDIYNPVNLTISGNLLFVSDWLLGLRVMDISDPSNPTQIVLLNELFNAEQVVIQDKYIYALNRDSGFYVLEYKLPDPAPTSLAFTQQPSGGTAGDNWTTQPAVEIKDQYGSTVTSDNTTEITLAIDANPSGGTLSGTTTITVSAGVATFSNLSIDNTGSGYTLEATSNPSYTAAISNAFDITPGALDHFDFDAPDSGTAGTPFSVTITAKDSEGNTTKNVSEATTLSVDSGTISPTSIAEADFTDNGFWTGNVTLSEAGERTITANNTGKTGSDAITIISMPTYTISGTVSGNLEGVVMIGLPANPSTNASGYYEDTVDHGWSGTVTPTLAGYTFTPSSRPYSNVTTAQTGQNYTPTVITPAISGSVGVVGATISFTGEGSTTSGSGGAYSHTVSYNWSGTVTPTLAGYTFTPSSRPYSNVTTAQTGQNYTPTLQFGLSFIVQPSDTVVNQPISPAIRVMFLDDTGNPLPGLTVNMEIGNNPGGATPLTWSAITNLSGIAQFFIVIDKAGTGYTLKATATYPGYGTMTAYSIAFNVM